MNSHAAHRRALRSSTTGLAWPCPDAIASHRDLPALFHELAGRLEQVVRFDYLSLVLHDPATNTMRLHVLETFEPSRTRRSCLPAGR